MSSWLRLLSVSRRPSQWAIARIYESAGDLKNLEKSYAEWRSEYGRDPGNADDYVFTFYNMAKIYEKKGKKKDADNKRKATIAAWSDIGKPAGGPAGTMAAEFDFREAEAFKVKFDKYKITKTPTTEKEARKVIAIAMQRYAADHVSDHSVSVVHLPSEHTPM